MLQRICRVLLVLALASSARASLAACLPDPPANGDDVVCDGTDSTGYDASGAADLTITTDGMAVLDESDPALDAAILVSDDNEVTIGTDATVNVTEVGGTGIQGDDGNTFTNEGTINVLEDDGYGLRAGNDNFIENLGTIVIDGDDGRAISLDQNTTGVLPNGAVNDGDIFLNGARGIGLEAGVNSGVANLGRIDVIGVDGRGISAADYTDFDIPADVSNSGTMNVIGDGAIGISAGDGWFLGMDDGGTPVPVRFGIFNNVGGMIDVSGANATGIRAGDNSLVANFARIDVTGAGAIGVSLGGNDLLDRFDIDSGDPLNINSFSNLGVIQGDDDTGPLVEIRSFVPGRENRIYNDRAGRLITDPANPDPVAIRGTDGIELVINLGTIQGDIDLAAGDDRFVQGVAASTTGTISGGAGFDEAVLAAGTGFLPTFDVSMLSGFERLEILGEIGWALENTAGFDGLTHVAQGARLRVPTPITLDGDFSVDPGGTLTVTLDPGTPPLTVQGMSTFDGTLEITPGPSLVPGPTSYRVVLANGGYTGQFDIAASSGINRFMPSYDALGLLVVYDQSLLFAANTANQRAIAQHLADVDAAGGASADLQEFNDDLDQSTGDLSITLNALSPEVYDVHTQVVVEGGRRIANLLLDRPRECEPGVPDYWNRIDKELPCHARSWAPWAAVVGGFRSREKHGGHPRYDAQLGGLVAGIDVHPMEGLDLTFAIGSQRGKLDAAGAGESTVTLTDVSGHAGYSIGPVRTQLVASWGHGFHHDRRLIRESQSAYMLDSRGNEQHDSDRITAAAEVGVLFDVFQFQVEPLVGVDWAWVYQRPIHESGAGGFGIRIASRDDSIGSVNAGMRLSTIYRHRRYLIRQLEWMDGVWRPSVEVRWRQMLHGDERSIDARLQGTPDAVGDFRIEGKEDSGGAEIGAAVSFTPSLANRLQFEFGYDAFVGPHTLEQDLYGRVTLGF